MKIFLLTLALAVAVSAQRTGQSTRYWDCCKPSCSWSANTGDHISQPVATCAANGVTVLPLNIQSACVGGTAFACNNNAPWAVNATTAYGFVAAVIAGQTQYDWCCSCYQMTFTSGPVAGRTMIVQVTNTGHDLGYDHFDIQIPGGGVGYFNQGCMAQWNAGPDGWGARYGGVSSEAECAQLPAVLQEGCRWRFQWLLGADNPNFTFVQVSCPAALLARSNCQ